MKNTNGPRSSRPVAIWLLIGVGMIIVQVLLGGITRLTGSGLSITEWKPIIGALPPINDQDWNEAFEKYQQIAQYKYLNSYFTLQDFKFIFFWEWLHRLWARLIGVVFLVPFIVFIVQRRFKKEMIRPLVILFLLGALQGLVGWIMVKSGLEDSDLIYVSHYKLAVHFILALAVLCYTTWFALELLVPAHQRFVHKALRRFTFFIVITLILQLVYGAFMAGLKAAPVAPTWPDINGTWFPASLQSFGDKKFNGLSFLADNPLVIHFIHRHLAYLIFILACAWGWKVAGLKFTPAFQRTKWIMPALVVVQVLLGIFSVLNVPDKNTFLWLAVSHQFVAMLLLLSLTWYLYLIRSEKIFSQTLL